MLRGTDHGISLSERYVHMEDTYCELKSSRKIILTNNSDKIVNFFFKSFPSRKEEDYQKRLMIGQLEQERESEYLFLMNEANDSLSLLPGETANDNATETETDSTISAGQKSSKNKKKIINFLNKKYRNIATNINNDLLLYNDIIFSVEPLIGTLYAHSSLLIQIHFHPECSISYQSTVYCQVCPANAIEEGEIEGEERRGEEREGEMYARLPLSLSGVGISPLVLFSFDELDIGSIYVPSTHVYECQMINKGDIPAHFYVDSSISNISFSPSEGTIPPKESINLTITMEGVHIGLFEEVFEFHVRGCVAPLLFTIRGEVIPPSFSFNLDKVDFGITSIGFNHTKIITLISTADVPFQYYLSIPPLPSPSSPSPLPQNSESPVSISPFLITPTTGTLLPNKSEKIQIDFYPEHPFDIHTSLIVDVPNVGTSLLSLPVTATVRTATVVSEPRDTLEFGDVYINYPSHLSLTLHNLSSIPAIFQVLSPKCECSHSSNLSPLSPPSPTSCPQCSQLQYEVDITQGVIPAVGSTVLTLSILVKTTGTVTCPFQFQIKGQEQLHTLLIVANSKGPDIVILDSSTNPPLLSLPSGDTNSPLPSLPSGDGTTPPPESTVEFGNVACLTAATREIKLYNNCCIDAEVFIYVASNSGDISLGEKKLSLPPFAVKNVSVSFHPTERYILKDHLVVTITNSRDLHIHLTGKSYGTPIKLFNNTSKVISLGDIFQMQAISLPFQLENKGRIGRQIEWHSSPSRSQESSQSRSQSRLTESSQERRDFFEITPSKTIISPKSTFTFSLEGRASSVGKISQTFTLLEIANQKKKKEIQVLVLQIEGNVIQPGLLITPSKVWKQFVFGRRCEFCNTGEMGEVREEREEGEESNDSQMFMCGSCGEGWSRLTCGEISLLNVATLEVELELQVPPPFICDQERLSLLPGEKKVFQVQIANNLRSDKVSHQIKEVISILDLNNPYKETIPSFVEFCYPNLEFSTHLIEFGNLFFNTSKSTVIKMFNNTIVPVRYQWCLEETEGDERGEEGEDEGGEIFDVRSVRGEILPFETQECEVTCFAKRPQMDIRDWNLMCIVENGPSYPISLRASFGEIKFDVSNKYFALHQVLFHQIQKVHFNVSNLGTIPFIVRTDLSSVSHPWRVQVEPSETLLEVGSKCSFTVSFLAGLPEAFEEVIYVQCGHLEPVGVRIVGEGVLSSLSVALPRVGEMGEIGERGEGEREKEKEIAVENLLKKKMEDSETVREHGGESRGGERGGEKVEEKNVGEESVFSSNSFANEGSLMQSLRSSHISESVVSSSVHNGEMSVSGTSLSQTSANPLSLSHLNEWKKMVRGQLLPGEIECELDRMNYSRILRHNYDDFFQNHMHQKLKHHNSSRTFAGSLPLASRNSTNQSQVVRNNKKLLMKSTVSTTASETPLSPLHSTPVKNSLSLFAKFAQHVSNISLPLCEHSLDFGPVSLGTQKTNSIKIYNHSPHPISFNIIRLQDSSNDFTVSPSSTVAIKAGEFAVLNVLVSRPVNFDEGPTESLLQLQVIGGPIYNVRLRATLVAPSLTLDSNEIEFGMLQLGASDSRHLRLRNHQSLPITWRLRLRPKEKKINVMSHTEVDTEEGGGETSLPFFPAKTHGIILPGAYEDVEIVFAPHHVSSSDYLKVLEACRKGEMNAPLVNFDGKYYFSLQNSIKKISLNLRGRCELPSVYVSSLETPLFAYPCLNAIEGSVMKGGRRMDKNDCLVLSPCIKEKFSISSPLLFHNLSSSPVTVSLANSLRSVKKKGEGEKPSPPAFVGPLKDGGEIACLNSSALSAPILDAELYWMDIALQVFDGYDSNGLYFSPLPHQKLFWVPVARRVKELLRSSSAGEEQIPEENSPKSKKSDAPAPFDAASESAKRLKTLTDEERTALEKWLDSIVSTEEEREFDDQVNNLQFDAALRSLFSQKCDSDHLENFIILSPWSSGMSELLVNERCFEDFLSNLGGRDASLLPTSLDPTKRLRLTLKNLLIWAIVRDGLCSPSLLADNIYSSLRQKIIENKAVLLPECQRLMGDETAVVSKNAKVNIFDVSDLSLLLQARLSLPDTCRGVVFDEFLLPLSPFFDFSSEPAPVALSHILSAIVTSTSSLRVLFFEFLTASPLETEPKLPLKNPTSKSFPYPKWLQEAFSDVSSSDPSQGLFLTKSLLESISAFYEGLYAFLETSNSEGVVETIRALYQKNIFLPSADKKPTANLDSLVFAFYQASVALRALKSSPDASHVSYYPVSLSRDTLSVLEQCRLLFSPPVLSEQTELPHGQLRALLKRPVSLKSTSKLSHQDLFKVFVKETNVEPGKLSKDYSEFIARLGSAAEVPGGKSGKEKGGEEKKGEEKKAGKGKIEGGVNSLVLPSLLKEVTHFTIPANGEVSLSVGFSSNEAGEYQHSLIYRIHRSFSSQCFNLPMKIFCDVPSLAVDRLMPSSLPSVEKLETPHVGLTPLWIKQSSTLALGTVSVSQAKILLKSVIKTLTEAKPEETKTDEKRGEEKRASLSESVRFSGEVQKYLMRHHSSEEGVRHQVLELHNPTPMTTVVNLSLQSWESVTSTPPAAKASAPAAKKGKNDSTGTDPLEKASLLPSPFLIDCEPIVLPPFQKRLTTIFSLPSIEGSHTDTLLFSIDQSEQVHSFLLSCIGSDPKISISSPLLSFPTCQARHQYKKRLTVENKGDLEAVWMIGLPLSSDSTVSSPSVLKNFSFETVVTPEEMKRVRFERQMRAKKGEKSTPAPETEGASRFLRLVRGVLAPGEKREVEATFTAPEEVMNSSFSPQLLVLHDSSKVEKRERDRTLTMKEESGFFDSTQVETVSHLNFNLVSQIDISAETVSNSVSLRYHGATNPGNLSPPVSKGGNAVSPLPGKKKEVAEAPEGESTVTGLRFGDILVKRQATQFLSVTNNNAKFGISVTFQILSHSLRKVLSFTPSSFQLSPGESTTVTATLLPIESSPFPIDSSDSIRMEIRDQTNGILLEDVSSFIPLSYSSHYSKCHIRPGQHISFPPVLNDTVSEKSLTLLNDGAKKFFYRFVAKSDLELGVANVRLPDDSSLPPSSTANPAKKGDADKKKEGDKKEAVDKKKEGMGNAPTFSHQSLTISPSEGWISPEETLEIKVTFQPKAVASTHSSFLLLLDGCQVLEEYQPLVSNFLSIGTNLTEFQGKMLLPFREITVSTRSDVPALSLDPSVLFDSHVVAMNPSQKDRKVSFFDPEANCFHFGTLLANIPASGNAPPAVNPKDLEKCERVEKFRLENLSLVPATVSVNLGPKQGAAPATGQKQQGGKNTSNSTAVGAFTLLSPNSLTIPPGGSEYITVKFAPTAVEDSSATVTVLLTNGATQEHSFHVSGDGRVPTVVASFNDLSSWKGGQQQLTHNFGQVNVGRVVSTALHLLNNSCLPCVVVINRSESGAKIGGEIDFDSPVRNIHLNAGDLISLPVKFIPTTNSCLRTLPTTTNKEMAAVKGYCELSFTVSVENNTRDKPVVMSVQGVSSNPPCEWVLPSSRTGQENTGANWNFGGGEFDSLRQEKLVLVNRERRWKRFEFDILSQQNLLGLLKVSPSVGFLPPLGSAEIKISIRAKRAYFPSPCLFDNVKIPVSVSPILIPSGVTETALLQYSDSHLVERVSSQGLDVPKTFSLILQRLQSLRTNPPVSAGEPGKKKEGAKTTTNIGGSAITDVNLFMQEFISGFRVREGEVEKEEELCLPVASDKVTYEDIAAGGVFDASLMFSGRFGDVQMACEPASLSFPPTLLFSEREGKVSLINKTVFDVPFAVNVLEEDLSIANECSSVRVSPQSGIVPANGTQQLSVTFAPEQMRGSEMKQILRVDTLFADDIVRVPVSGTVVRPIAKVDSDCLKGEELSKCLQSVLRVPTARDILSSYESSKPFITETKPASETAKNASETAKSASEAAKNANETAKNASETAKNLGESSLQVLKFDVCSSQGITKKIRIKNLSLSPLPFDLSPLSLTQAEKDTDRSKKATASNGKEIRSHERLFDISPASGVIPPQETCEVHVHFSPHSIDAIQKDLYVLTMHQKTTLSIPFLFLGEHHEPEIILDTSGPLASFANTLIGTNQVRVIRIINKEPVPFSFQVDKPSLYPNDMRPSDQSSQSPPSHLSSNPSSLSIIPSKGEIAPNETLSLQLRFSPQERGLYQWNTRILFSDSKVLCKSLSLPVNGSAVLPTCELSWVADDGKQVPLHHQKLETLALPDTFTNSSQSLRLCLHNKGETSLHGEWFVRLPVSNKTRSKQLFSLSSQGDTPLDIKNSLSFSPPLFQVQPNDNLDIQFTYSPSLNGFTLSRDCQFMLQINGGVLKYLFDVETKTVKGEVAFGFTHFDFGTQPMRTSANVLPGSPSPMMEITSSDLKKKSGRSLPQEALAEPKVGYETDVSGYQMRCVTLTIANKDATEGLSVSLQGGVPSWLILPSAFSSVALGPLEMVELPVCFVPAVASPVSGYLSFLINGSTPANIRFSGRGCVLHLETETAFMRHIKFPDFPLGEKRIEKVYVINKSPVSVSCSLSLEETDASNATHRAVSLLNSANNFFSTDTGVSISPKTLTLPPHKKTLVTVTFNPTKPTPNLSYSVLANTSYGIPMTLFSITANTVFSDLQVSNTFIRFNNTIIGSQDIYRLRLYNQGDLPCRYSLQLLPLSSLSSPLPSSPKEKKKSLTTLAAKNTISSPSDFLLPSTEGVLQGREESKVDVLFSPHQNFNAKNVGAILRVAVIMGRGNGKTTVKDIPLLSKTIDRSLASVENLFFKTAVRSTERRYLSFVNKTDKDWLFAPQMNVTDAQCFSLELGKGEAGSFLPSGYQKLLLPPGEKVTLQVTYNPSEMTAETQHDDALPTNTPKTDNAKGADATRGADTVKGADVTKAAEVVKGADATKGAEVVRKEVRKGSGTRLGSKYVMKRRGRHENNIFVSFNDGDAVNYKLFGVALPPEDIVLEEKVLTTKKKDTIYLSVSPWSVKKKSQQMIVSLTLTDVKNNTTLYSTDGDSKSNTSTPAGGHDVKELLQVSSLGEINLMSGNQKLPIVFFFYPPFEKLMVYVKLTDKETGEYATFRLPLVVKENPSLDKITFTANKNNMLETAIWPIHIINPLSIPIQLFASTNSPYIKFQSQQILMPAKENITIPITFQMTSQAPPTGPQTVTFSNPILGTFQYEIALI